MEQTLWIKIRERRKRRDFVFWTFILLCSLYMLWDVGTGYLKYRELVGRQATLQAKIASINAGNERIKTQMHEFKTNNFYKEKMAREDFGRAKPGELVFIFQGGNRQERGNSAGKHH